MSPEGAPLAVHRGGAEYTSPKWAVLACGFFGAEDSHGPADSGGAVCFPSPLGPGMWQGLRDCLLLLLILLL